MNRCLNNIFAYCSGEPKSTTREKEWNVSPDTGNRKSGKYTETVSACKLGPTTCGKYSATLE